MRDVLLFLGFLTVPGLVALGVMAIGTGLYDPRDDRRNP